MSNFNLDDEILFKAKYLKYKNKYIELKEQLAGDIYGTHDVVILYNSGSFPGLENLRKEYITAVHSENAYTGKTTKSLNPFSKKQKTLSIEEFIKQKVDLQSIEGSNNIFGLPFIFGFPIVKSTSKTSNIKSLITLSAKNLYTGKISKELQKDVSNDKKVFSKNIKDLKNFKVILDESTTSKILPLLCENLNENVGLLINELNTRISALQDYYSTLYGLCQKNKADELMFRDKPISNALEKVLSILDNNGSLKQISELPKFDAYMVVKNLSIKDDTITFVIDNIGSSNLNPSPTGTSNDSTSVNNPMNDYTNNITNN